MTTTIISIDDYFSCWITHPDVTPDRMAKAVKLLPKVNGLLQDALDKQVPLNINPVTGTYVSGRKNGYGGFRPQDCPQGATKSAHKDGRGVDVYDFGDALDEWLDSFETGNGGNTKLEEFGLYREAPYATESWLHLSDRAPGSGHRTYDPK